jgi:hypothetical protein
MFPSGARMMLAGLLRRFATGSEVDLQCRDVDMTPPEVPALAADFDVVVSHRDETTQAPFGERFLVVRLLREPLDVVLPPRHPPRPAPAAAPRRAGRRGLDQRGGGLARRRRAAVVGDAHGGDAPDRAAYRHGDHLAGRDRQRPRTGDQVIGGRSRFGSFATIAS